MVYSLPRNDELEISVFGPGYGECILIHIGNGEWIIIDSCIDKKTKRPAALDYLENLGVSLSESVSLVVATHWHDDHVRGLGAIISECTGARFVCSMAIKNEEFFKLMDLYKHNILLKNHSGVDEFISIFNTLQVRNTLPKFAVSERKIWERPKSKATPGCTVQSLSPSDFEIVRALQSIAKQLPLPGTIPTRITAPRQNDSAVVLWVKIGNDTIILLGADLEDEGDSRNGWTAIVEGNMVGKERAKICKVAHHGSTTGHCQLVWDEMLEKNPWALLTPFSRGGKPLPSDQDIDRINGQTNRAYITFPAQKNSKRKRKDPLVKRIIGRHTKSIRYAERLCGQVMLRRRLSESNGEWQVTLNGDACRLSKQK